jgi:hypothetical protein
MDKIKWVRVSMLASAMLGGAACTSATSLAPDDEALDLVTPQIAENGDFRVAVEPEIEAGVDVRSREFASMEELYRFAIEEMGGEPVYDEGGRIAGVRGTSVLSGDVRFRDEETDEIFRADDLAQAFLGGADGTIRVAGERIEIGAPSVELDVPGVITAPLSDDSLGCAGSDCISGHSWKTNYVVYRSVGSETKQSSGGYSTYSYACCSAVGGTPVYVDGRLQCRYVTEWEPADPENGQYRPIPIAYGYRNPGTCTGTTTRNTLTLGVTAIADSGWATAYTERTEVNTREVSMSAWGVGLGVDFLGIDDVDGLCGYHTGSRGTTTRTRAGSATDAQCDPGLPVFAVIR